MAFSPDGGLVASGSIDQTVKVWEDRAGRCVNTLLFDQEIRAVAFVGERPLWVRMADGMGRVFEYEVRGSLYREGRGSR